MAIETIASGSLIIPMDIAYQDKGMFLAYGLVYRLLAGGIPVKWAILTGKAYDGIDFTATTRNYTVPLETATSKSYNGGPFIVPAANAAAAGPIIDAYQSANLTQFPSAGKQPVVHVATASFSADIAYTLSRPPRIAVEDTNFAIMQKYLNTSKIPDGNGNTWTSSSPGVLTDTEINNGALFGINRAAVPKPSELCLKRAYDIFLSPHTSDATWNGTIAADDMVDFFEHGGFLHATCHSMSAFENYSVGPILLTSKNQTTFNDNQGDTSTFRIDKPDYPSAQTVSRGVGTTQSLPGGSEQTWLHSDVTYNPHVFVLAHFMKSSTQYDFSAGGAFRGIGAGVAVYEGGHEYKDTEKIPASASYSTIEDSVYQRLVLNTIFFSVGKPYFEMAVSPQNVSSSSPTAVTYTMTNTGGSPALYTAPFVVTLPSYITFNSAVPSPDNTATVAGQTVLTWNVGSLPGGPGTVLTINATTNPPIPTGKQTAISYQGSWNDAYGQPATVSLCTAFTALAGAAPNITKTPATITVGPNDLVTWTITVKNTGTLALNSIVVKDTLPPGFTLSPAGTSTPYSPASPAPGGTITWNTSPPLPASNSLVAGGTMTLTIAAYAPKATSGLFTNTVNLTGTDGTTNFDITATSQVVIANSPPTVTVTSPTTDYLSCSNTNIQWTASDSDGDTPLYITLFYSSNGLAGPFNQITTIPSPLLQPPTTSYNWDTTGVPSGNNYVVKVVASDGNLSSEALSGVFKIDNTYPTVSWVYPSNGALLNTTPVILQASATDNIGVTQVEFFYSTDGINYTSIGIDNLPVGDIYSTSWELAGLSQGTYYLKAVASDQCQKQTPTTITVQVNLPPTVTLIKPNGGELVCPKDGIDVTWSASDPNPGATLTFTLQYSFEGGPFTTFASDLTGSTYHWDTSGLDSGSYIVKIIASDGLTTAEDVSNAPFTIDNEPPVVNIISPLNNSFISETVTVSATATNNVAVTKVLFEYSANGGATFTAIGPPVTIPSGSTYSISWDTTSVDDGEYIIRATAYDKCDITGEDTVTVTVDNTPPTVEIESPPDGSEVNGTVPLVISGADNECLSKVQLYIDGILVYTDVVGGDTSTEFIFDWDTTGYPEGEHIVRAVATDCAGLTAETESTYIVNNLPDCYVQVLVDGKLEIPTQKPPMERVINLDVTPDVRDIDIFSTIDGTKIKVGGFVDIGVTYVANDEQQTEHFAHFSVPFTATILCPDFPIDAEAEPVIMIEHVQWHILGPKTLKKDIVMFVGVREKK